MSKIYLNKNVYDSAIDRIEYSFKNFDHIYLSFSGGKDSGVMLNLVMDYMIKNKIKKKVGVLFIDLEAQYKETINYILRELDTHRDRIDPYWLCLPINLRNAVSVYQPFWTPWDAKNKDKWVRDYPDFPIKKDMPFFKQKMEFEQLIIEFGDWYSKGRKTACLVGIRSDESLNRFRTIASRSKQTADGLCWTTKVNDNVFNIYPIYDWATEDIWTANAKKGWDYNKIYDLFYKAGVSIHLQRICQPYGDDQRAGLDLFRVMEPQTWCKVVNRVSGANFGNIYCGKKVMGYGKVRLPKGHNWKSYTKLLLESLPPELRDHYIIKFRKFMRYWSKTGCPYTNDDVDILPPESILTDNYSTRGNKDKKTVIYKRVPDTGGSKAESKKLCPSWRRMAICILKNDHLCKTLSFTQTKEQRKKIDDLMQKYRRL